MSGTELVPQLLKLQPKLRVVVLTGYGSIASAVEAMRLGAHNYVSKPADADDVLAAVTGDARPVETGAARTAPVSPPPTLARAEWEHIQRILADTGNNVSETARRLGITRRTLQLKLKKYPPRV
jgi:two-component system response regulator RegA